MFFIRKIVEMAIGGLDSKIGGGAGMDKRITFSKIHFLKRAFLASAMGVPSIIKADMKTIS